MLVLSRKVGQSIVLPACDAIVTVVRVSGKKVRLGVTAPLEVAVHREETWAQIVGSPRDDVPLRNHGNERVRVLVAAPDTRFLQHCRNLACRGRLDIGVASDGDACIQQLVVFHPHLLILDIGLPPAGAMGTVAALSKRQELPATPVIILGVDAADQVSSWLNFPIIDRLPSPITLEQLERRIVAFFEHPPAAIEHASSGI